MRRLVNCLFALLGAIALLIILFVFFNWGFWKSTAENLFGFDFPLVKRYQTDLSGRGREAGSFITVYSLPENFDALLKEHRTDIENQPAYRSGFETDGYTRVTWTHTFPRNAAEQNMYESFFARRTVLAPTPSISEISTDAGAYALAASLREKKGTYYGGWYKRQRWPGDPPETVWITDHYIYLLNIEEGILVKFGLQT